MPGQCPISGHINCWAENATVRSSSFSSH